MCDLDGMRTAQLFRKRGVRHDSYFCICQRGKAEKEGVFTYYEQIGALEDMLRDKGLCRCHKSCLINLKYVEVYNRQEAVLENGETIMVAKRRYEEFCQEILDDLDIDFVGEYIKQIGYQKNAISYLTENKGFVKKKDGKLQISTAAVLLFGRNPQNFFPRARIRFIRYDGLEERFGAEMNVVKDVIFEGNILKVVTDSIAYLDTQIKEKTYLGKDGLFVTEEEYPKFVRQEIIVNCKCCDTSGI